MKGSIKKLEQDKNKLPLLIEKMKRHFLRKPFKFSCDNESYYKMEDQKTFIFSID